MAKFCKKCGKELPTTEKGGTCKSCKGKKNNNVRNIGGVLMSAFGVVIWRVIKSKKN